jgi:hypothetical protein
MIPLGDWRSSVNAFGKKAQQLGERTGNGIQNLEVAGGGECAGHHGGGFRRGQRREVGLSPAPWREQQRAN